MPKVQVNLEVFGDLGAPPRLRSVFGQFLKFFPDTIRMGRCVPLGDGMGQAQLVKGPGGTVAAVAPLVIGDCWATAGPKAFEL